MTTQLAIDFQQVAPLRSAPEVVNMDGLLWYEPGPVVDRVANAAARFYDKFGEGWPEVAELHPDEMPDVGLVALEPGRAIRLVASAYTLRGHVLVRNGGGE